MSELLPLVNTELTFRQVLSFMIFCPMFQHIMVSILLDDIATITWPKNALAMFFPCSCHVFAMLALARPDGQTMVVASARPSGQKMVVASARLLCFPQVFVMCLLQIPFTRQAPFTRQGNAT